MAYLDRLLAPYLSAMSGAPSTEASMSQDPIYGSLFSSGGLDDLSAPSMGMGGPMASGIPWGRFGGDIENLYSGVEGHEGSHLHIGASQGPIGKLLRRIQRMGFNVGEHPGFGGVDPVHTKGSLHYSSNAGDVNWYNPSRGYASRFNSEDQALRWLENWLAGHGLRTN